LLLEPYNLNKSCIYFNFRQNDTNIVIGSSHPERFVCIFHIITWKITFYEGKSFGVAWFMAIFAPFCQKLLEEQFLPSRECPKSPIKKIYFTRILLSFKKNLSKRFVCKRWIYFCGIFYTDSSLKGESVSVESFKKILL